MYRLFTAIDLPATVKAELTALCCGLPGAKWVAPEQMHLTLRFIGEVDGGIFRDISGLVKPEPRKFAPHITLARLQQPPRERLGRFLAGNGLYASEPFTVAGFALYSSVL